VSDTPTPPPVETESESQLLPAPPSLGARKSPRLPLEFAVVARYGAPDGEMVRVNCKTVSVGVNGALLALNRTVTVGQSMQLTNAKTAQELQCIVKSIRQMEKENVYHVGVEFLSWAPEFWEITFPRQEGDPSPGSPSGSERPAKPFFGRVGPMPASPREEDSPDANLGNSAEQSTPIQSLANRLWRRNKPSK
jgi:hypothetical protein